MPLTSGDQYRWFDELTMVYVSLPLFSRPPR
jgi:hypothetical protein